LWQKIFATSGAAVPHKTYALGHSGETIGTGVADPRSNFAFEAAVNESIFSSNLLKVHS
jgi:hypothetical protein